MVGEEAEAPGELSVILLLRSWVGIGDLLDSYVGLGLLVIVGGTPHLSDCIGEKLEKNNGFKGLKC